MTTAGNSPTPDDQFLADCLRYLDGEMSEQDFADFQSKLESDPSLQERFVELSLLSECIAEASGSENAEEALAMADLVTRTQVIRSVNADDLKKVSGTEAFSLVGHLVCQTARTHALAIGSVAALMLLALALWFVFSSPTSSDLPNGQFVVEPKDSEVTLSVGTPIVATLTAERDVVWDRRPGQDLYAGQRFTLNQGFAEITTASGAVAILEAPATIELLNHDNALRLIEGKLVGICETESSKGFVVSTRHMDITDLGTRFGVSVDSDHGTITKVFDGFVRVASTASTPQPLEPVDLGQGQSIAVDPNGQRVSIESFDPDLFVSLQQRDSGIERVQGAVRGSSRLPGLIARGDRTLQDSAIIYNEVRELRLSEDLFALLSEPGRYGRFNDLKTHTIPSGTVIQSYLIDFTPDPANGFTTCEGSVSFEGEVLGVIAFSDDWHRFAEVMSTTGEPFFRFSHRLISPSFEGGGDDADVITISDDRRSISFELSAGPNPEVFRVITRKPGD